MLRWWVLVTPRGSRGEVGVRGTQGPALAPAPTPILCCIRVPRVSDPRCLRILGHGHLAFTEIYEKMYPAAHSGDLHVLVLCNDTALYPQKTQPCALGTLTVAEPCAPHVRFAALGYFG